MQTIQKIIHSPSQCGFYLVLLAALLRVLNILFLADSPLFAVPTSDAGEHFALAKRVAASDWLARGEGVLWRPALFSWVCAALFKIVGASFMAVHGLVLVSDLVAVGMWYAVAWRCFSPAAAAVGGLGVALYKPFIHFASTGYMESFAMALIAGMMLCLVIYFHTVNGRGYARPLALLALAGLLGGFSILNRPTILLVMPLIALLVGGIWLARERPKYLMAIGAMLIFMMTTTAGMAPNAVRHWIVVREFIPIGVASDIAFHMGNNDDGWGWEVSSPGLEYDIYRDTPTAIGNRPIEIGAVRDYWREQNKQFVSEKPSQFLAGLIVKLLQTWNAYEIHLTNDFREHSRISPVERYSLPSAVVIPLGFIGLVICFWDGMARLSRRGHRDETANGASPGADGFGRALLCVWVVVYTFGVALYMANTRHRLPAFPPLVLLAGYAVGEGVRVWRARRENWRPLAALIILMLAGIVLSRLPVIPRWMPVHEDWWTHINKGTALVQLDRDEEAAKEFRLATQVMPQKLEGWRQLALAREELGQYPEAVAAQEELLRLMNAQYPQYTAARAEQLEKLVTLIATAGDLPRAADLSRDLINLAPHNFRPYAMAAKISHAAGQTTVAINQLQRAEALAEGNPDAMKIVDSVRRQLK